MANDPKLTPGLVAHWHPALVYGVAGLMISFAMVYGIGTVMTARLANELLVQTEAVRQAIGHDPAPQPIVPMWARPWFAIGVALAVGCLIWHFDNRTLKRYRDAIVETGRQPTAFTLYRFMWMTIGIIMCLAAALTLRLPMLLMIYVMAIPFAANARLHKSIYDGILEGINDGRFEGRIDPADPEAFAAATRKLARYYTLPFPILIVAVVAGVIVIYYAR